MKIWLKMTLLFTVLQVIVTILIGGTVLYVVRNTVVEMVEQESRAMLSAITETVAMCEDQGDSFRMVEQYILNRQIGENGFYFVLDRSGKYLVHPNPSVKGENWAGQEDFIDYILANYREGPEKRFARYVSPKTGQWKQVYFQFIPENGWIVCSSAWEHEMYAPIKSIAIVLGGILIAALLISSLVIVRTSRHVGKALNRIAGSLERVGQGDLTVEVGVDRWSKETEVATQSLNEAVVVNMRNTIMGVKNSSIESKNIKNELTTAAEETGAALNEITANVKSIQNRIEHLMENIEGNTGSMEKISSNMGDISGQISEQSAMIEESTASINEMLSSVINVSGITTQRREATSKLADNTRTASSQLNEANRIFREGVASKIGSIQEAAESIQKIAAQTNLLAMNAAIEAAHAGDAGKGFAVVASEIRNLAENSSTSSKTISETIKSIVQNIERSGETFQEVESSFSNTVEESQQTVDAFQEIESSTLELTEGGKQILTAMTSLEETSNNIKERAEMINSDAQSVYTSEKEIKDLSFENTQGINEISIGISEVNDAMQLVNELNIQLGKIVDDIEAGIKIFRTEKSEES